MTNFDTWELCSPLPFNTTNGVSFFNNYYSNNPSKASVFCLSPANIQYAQVFEYYQTLDGWDMIDRLTINNNFGIGNLFFKKPYQVTEYQQMNTYNPSNYTRYPFYNVYTFEPSGNFVEFFAYSVRDQNAGSKVILTESDAYYGACLKNSIETIYVVGTDSFYSDGFCVLNMDNFVHLYSGETFDTAYCNIRTLHQNKFTWSNFDNTITSQRIGINLQLFNDDCENLIIIDSGIITSATQSGIIDLSKNWKSNEFRNLNLFIYSGSGAGAIRQIVSNSNNSINVHYKFIDIFDTTEFIPLPESGSKYFIIPNLNTYIIGNSSTTMGFVSGIYASQGQSWQTLKYSTNDTTIANYIPSGQRSGAPGNGLTGSWVYNTSDPSINGRRIYSFRGGGSAELDYFDITTETWTNVQYNKLETFNTGTSYAYPGGDWIYIQKDNTGRWFRFNVVTHTMEPWGTCLYPQGAAVAGNKAFYTKYTDYKGDDVVYIHMILNSSNVHVRKRVTD